MGAVARRPMAWLAAIVLVAEAVGVVFVNGVLAMVVDNQQMSLAGVDSAAMFAGTWATGGVFGLYLVVCAGILARTAVRDRAPGRFGRIVLISCAVVHGVLGALTVGLVGWTAFAVMMAVMGLVVLALVAYESEPRPGKRTPGPPALGDPAPGGQAPGEQAPAGQVPSDERARA
ncbi:hypothetical protein ACFXKG_40040 [Streptomyces sp. NPDC059255]|uniref:hypothetical protein n=1 Tax=Streptomyces sp. NPDC059255 TaxID=3346793 RepID=UPI0036AE07BD